MTSANIKMSELTIKITSFKTLDKTNINSSNIDAILVYKKQKMCDELQTFFANLKGKGINLTSVPSELDPDLIFVKVNAPDEVLLKYADEYGITLKKDQSITFPRAEVPFKCLENILNSPHPDLHNPISKRAWKTISGEHPTEITLCERSVLVFLIMDYIKFSISNFDVGIRQLIHKKIIFEAYPLHDGPWEWPSQDNEPLNDRQLLAEYWANFSMFFKQQPLNIVKAYYGYEIAMYFAWLGFYNKMLTYAAILGIITFLCGFLFINSYDKDHLDAYCNHTGVMCNGVLINNMNIKDLEPIASTCPYVYVTYLNSNFATFCYSIAMVLWCTMFKEYWKRELNVLNAKWDKPETEDFILRPQFIANATNTRRHMYTGEVELYISFYEEFLRYTCSTIGTILTISVVIASLIATIHMEYHLMLSNFSRITIILITCTTSLISIIVLELLFNSVLKNLTKIEMPRTQLDYEKSIIIKTSIFAFFNSYGRLIYIAFFKGKLPTFEKYINGEPKKKYALIPSEYCLPPSCVFEVICLLIAILVIKPIIFKLLELIKTQIVLVMKKKKIEGVRNLPKWEKDFALHALDRRSILGELGNLIIQYGFVSFFAACCPLAPLFALIYNLILMRMEATKIVKFFKRPVERKRVTSIGICFDIFETMSYIAIIMNALFMAYTCKYVHMFVDYSKKESLIKDPVILNEFSKISYPYSTGKNEECYMLGLYETNSTGGNVFKFVRPVEHYDLLTYKAYLALAFLLLGFMVSGVVSYIIPDVPRDLQEYIHYYEQLEKNKEL